MRFQAAKLVLCCQACTELVRCCQACPERLSVAPRLPCALRQAYTDCALWGRLAAGGYRNVRQHFSVEVARHAVLKVRCVGRRA